MKNWKKLKMFLTAAAAATVMMAAPLAVSAADYEVELEDGKTYTDDDGITYTFTISGNAATLTGVNTDDAEKGCKVIVPGAVIKNGTSVPVIKLGSAVFSQNEDIASIDLSDTSISTMPMGSRGVRAFEDCTALTEVQLPKTLTQLTAYMFSGCSSLRSIEIPAKVTTFVIGASANPTTSTAHTRMFENCDSLTEITVADGNTKFKSEDGVLFSNDGTILYAYPCGKIDETYEVPKGVTAIYPGAFQTAQNLKKVIIPESVTVIGQYAFNGYGTAGDSNNSLEEAVLYGNPAQGKFAFIEDNVTITQMVTGVKVTAEKKTIDVGEKITLSATVSPSAASNTAVTWSVDNTDAAEIDQSGTLTAKAPGTVVVTAKAQDGSGKSGSLKITISKKVIKPELFTAVP